MELKEGMQVHHVNEGGDLQPGQICKVMGDVWKKGMIGIGYTAKADYPPIIIKRLLKSGSAVLECDGSTCVIKQKWIARASMPGENTE